MTHAAETFTHDVDPPAKVITWQKWPQDHADYYVELAGQNLSYAQMADEMNKKFGTDYTRNALVGRAARTGVKSSYKQIHKPGPKPKVRLEPRLRVVAANGNSNVKRVSAAFVAMVEPVEPVPIEGLQLRHVRLLDLRPEDCRFECSGQDDVAQFTFCGNPAKNGSPYCRAHSTICFTPPQASKRPPYIQHGTVR